MRQRKAWFIGQPVLVEFRPRLRVARGALICGGNGGREVHAGAFLRQRLIVLDRALLRNARERNRILAHEIFHFVWWKLGRATRKRYEGLIREEAGRSIRGEMGWSSELRKGDLRDEDWLGNTRAAREYLCESFCDTAAAYLLGLADHDEITLSKRARLRRRSWMRNWMEETLAGGGLKI